MIEVHSVANATIVIVNVTVMVAIAITVMVAVAVRVIGPSTSALSSLVVVPVHLSGQAIFIKQQG